MLGVKWINFTIPFVPGYKDKDEHFINFICKDFPAHLAKIEARLAAQKGKFMLGNDLTLADFVVAIPFFLLSHNDGFEFSHIVASVVSKYPKTNAWIENFHSLNKDSLNKNVRPF